MLAIVKKWGNSQGIRVPKAILNLIDIKIDEDVEINIEDNKTIISKVNDPDDIDLRLLFKDYKGNYKPKEIDLGKPKGREVW